MNLERHGSSYEFAPVGQLFTRSPILIILTHERDNSTTKAGLFFLVQRLIKVHAYSSSKINAAAVFLRFLARKKRTPMLSYSA